MISRKNLLRLVFYWKNGYFKSYIIIWYLYLFLQPRKHFLVIYVGKGIPLHIFWKHTKTKIILTANLTRVIFVVKHLTKRVACGTTYELILGRNLLFATFVEKVLHSKINCQHTLENIQVLQSLTKGGGGSDTFWNQNGKSKEL